jgi:class 3 adenylate cyclase
MLTRVPTTRYARAEGGYVAYQIFGDGPIDILFIGNWASNIEIMWEEPALHRYFDRLGSIGRVACFDKRGVGVSDPVPLAELPTLEQWMDDARVVLDVLGWGRAAVIGDAEGGPMAMLLTASFPERVTALVLVNTFARMLRADDYPIGMPSSAAEKVLSLMEQYWGTDALLALTAPTAANDSRLRQWMARYMRLSAPPGASRRLYGWVLQLDVRSVLSSIHAPTLVIHRAQNPYYRPAQGRYIAEHIPGARYVEVPGRDWYPPSVDAEPILGEIEEFLTGERPAREPDRVLATVMFTDIVASSERAADIGDHAWLDLRQSHDALVRAHLESFRGREIATTGDGFLATFDGPARAVQCAAELASAVSAMGLEIRAGIHTGEVELREQGIGGIAVHIAARVQSAARPGRVAVSSTVKDLVVGSGIEFTELGERTLKGIPGEWRLYEVVDAAAGVGRSRVSLDR